MVGTLKQPNIHIWWSEWLIFHFIWCCTLTSIVYSSGRFFSSFDSHSYRTYYLNCWLKNANCLQMLCVSKLSIWKSHWCIMQIAIFTLNSFSCIHPWAVQLSYPLKPVNVQLLMSWCSKWFWLIPSLSLSETHSAEDRKK